MELKTRINQLVSQTGVVRILDVDGEDYLRVVIEGAGALNKVQVSVRIQGQSDYVLLKEITGSANEKIKVSTYEEAKIECTVIDAIDSNIKVLISSFNEASGSAIEIDVPAGENISDIEVLTFTSSDNSVVISGDNTTKEIDLTVNLDLDDVREYPSLASFPAIGQTNTLYVALDTELVYRYSGTIYIEVSPSAVRSVNLQTGDVVLTKSDVGLSNVDNTSDVNKPISSATQLALNDKEDSANKSDDENLGSSTTLYPTQRAVKEYVDTLVSSGTIPDATATVKGVLKLTGDLSGTADSPTVPALLNKVSKTGDIMSGILYMGSNSFDIGISEYTSPSLGSDVAITLILNTDSGSYGNTELVPSDLLTGIVTQSQIGAALVTNIENILNFYGYGVIASYVYDNINHVFSINNTTAISVDFQIDYSPMLIGSISINKNRIKNLQDGTSSSDAVTVTQLSQKQDLLGFIPLDRAGDNMLGTLGMGGGFYIIFQDVLVSAPNIIVPISLTINGGAPVISLVTSDGSAIVTENQLVTAVITALDSIPVDYDYNIANPNVISLTSTTNSLVYEIEGVIQPISGGPSSYNQIKFLEDGTDPKDAVNKSQLDTKQATLISGTNIKTINGLSVLGSGNLVIGGGGSSSLEIKDEGTQQTSSAVSIDFVGSAVSATSDLSGNVTVTINSTAGAVDSVNTKVGDVVLNSADLLNAQAVPSNWSIPDNSTIKAHLDALAEVRVDQNTVTKEPTGFETRADSTISFSDSSPDRTFTIAPVAASFTFYVKGKKFTKTVAENLQLPNASGNHYIYYNPSGVLESTQVSSADLFTGNALVAIVYFNTETNTHSYFGEERHGLQMDGATHGYLHTVFGSQYLSGLALQNFIVDGDGSLDTQAQFTGDQGSIRDEDLLIQIPAQTQIPVLYRIGTLWRKKAADAFPMIYSGTAGYAGSRLPYNESVGGSYQLTEVANNAFVLVHFFGTNDIENPIVAIQGTNTYGNVSEARGAASTEITSLSGIPFAEFVAIGSVVLETANGYTNTPKAIVRSVDGANYVDFRGTQLYTPAGVASSHSLLSNLSSDDHLQYHTDARGDARYYTKSQADTLLLAKYDASNPAGYITLLQVPVTTVNSQTGDVVLNKEDVGLSNVDNTSDANKPVSTATQTALNGKEDVANKSTNTSLGSSDSLYPTQNAVKSYVDNVASGKANTDLSNLVTTSIPSGVNIISNSSAVPFSLRTVDNVSGSTGAISVASGAAGAGISSYVELISGTATTGSGAAYLETGRTTTGASGPIFLTSGSVAIASGTYIDNSSNTSATGPISLSSGSSTNVSSAVRTGSASLRSGQSSGTLGTGFVTVGSGTHNGTSGNSGQSVFQSGTASASGGSSGLAAIQSGSVSLGSGTSGAVLVNSGATVNGNSGQIQVISGAPTGTGVSGQLLIRSGNVALVGGSSASGPVFLSTGTTVNGASGLIDVNSGSPSGSGASGAVRVFSGNTVNGNSGTVLISSGASTTGGSTGSVTLQTGTTSGTRGDVLITAPNLNLQSNKIINTAEFYFGDPNTDGTYRIRPSGNNLITERREGGVWVTKQTITP
jgi:hypothetical protein